MVSTVSSAPIAAGVEAGVDAHRRDAGDRFSASDRPLHGRCAAVLRQQRGVQIDVAERRQVKHPLRNDAAVADHDDRIGLEGAELRAKFVVGFDSVGLRDGHSQLQGGLLDR
jgi:hypothetical protein